MGRDDRTRLVGDRGGDGVIEGAEPYHFFNPWIFRFECPPSLITAVEGRDTGNIDVAGLPTIAVVFDRLLENEAGKIAVGLLDLRDIVVLDVDVKGNDLSAGIDRALHGNL